MTSPAAARAAPCGVIPYSMYRQVLLWPKSAVFTDSIYVVLNMAIMTRVGQKVWDTLATAPIGLRAPLQCDIDAEKRYIMHFPE